MLTIDKLRKIDSTLETISDEELLSVRDRFYDLGRLIFDDWLENKVGSKYPARVLRKLEESNKIKL